MAQALRRITGRDALVIARHRFRSRFRIEPQLDRQIPEEEFGEARQRDAIRPSDVAIKPCAELHEGGEWRCVAAAPEQRRGFDKIPAVAYKVPIPREAAHVLHLSK